MPIIIERKLEPFQRFRKIPARLKGAAMKKELMRGLIDAGRKTRTQVQRAVAKQMNVTPGGYQGYVTPNMRTFSTEANLSYTIRATGKGSNIETYRGLRALSEGGRTAKRANKGRSISDQGFVTSSVWGVPRVFKRSFSSNGGFFALVPGGGSGRLPKAFWTFGKKADQPRDADGRFAKSGQPGFKVRKLYGPALGKELDKDMSLQTFETFGPRELEIQIQKRIAKLITY